MAVETPIWLQNGTPCREYAGSRTAAGYGRRSGGKRQYMHRWVMEQMGHNIDGKVVMHLCDNPPCFRYDHLRVGTQQENIDDMRRKGRNEPPPLRRVGIEITHCPHGHEYTDDNMVSNGKGMICRTCRTTRLAKRDRRNG